MSNNKGKNVVFHVTERIGHYGLFSADSIKEWLRMIVVAFCIVYILNTYIIVNANVPTGSMIPTINPGEKIIANRISYFSNSPKRGDIVVFRHPDNPQILLVKRIIGLPGDEVLIRNGILYINGIELKESYVLNTDEDTYGPYKVPKNCYFMLGDNRISSEDSRFWLHKYVEKEKILGKVKLKYSLLPLSVKKIN